MLGLYLYTLIISHKSCNMLTIQNKLTLQSQHSVTKAQLVTRDRRANLISQFQPSLTYFSSGYPKHIYILVNPYF